MKSSDQTAALVEPGIEMSLQREEQMVQYFCTLVEQTQKEMGAHGNGSFERDSWLWKRQVASRRWENDFRDRIEDPFSRLWRLSNRSFNQPQVAIEQHFARMSKPFKGGRFLTLTADDDEDEHPGMKLAERLLQERSEEIDLGTKLKEHAILNALKRGEAVAKIMPAQRVRREVREVRIGLQPDGSVIKDSLGGVITDQDKWITIPENPAMECLARDKGVTKPAGAEVRFSDKTVQRLVPITHNAGAEFEYPYWADLIISLNAPTLDAADCKAHRFEMRLDDLLEILPSEQLIAGNLQRYRDDVGQAAVVTAMARPHQALAEVHRGEMDADAAGDNALAVEGTLPLQQYVEVWGRWDADGDGYREPIMILLDIQRRQPIWYGRAHEVLQSETRTHPFICDRVYPVEGRWYGRGYYDQFSDLSDSADADLCRTEIEKAKSGNLIFENRNATSQGRAGRPLQFRSPETYHLEGQHTGDDACSVVTVKPQLEAIEASMDRTLNTLSARSGGISPGETEGADLQAANTATGLQILQETKNDQAELRADELNQGIEDKLMVWAELELRFKDDGFIADLFADGTVEVSSIDPDTGVEVMVDKPKAAVLEEFLAMVKAEKLARAVTLEVSQAHGGEILVTNDNIIKLLQAWDAFVAETMMSTPDFTKALARLRARRPVFSQMLKALKVTEPERLLDLPEPPPPMDVAGQVVDETGAPIDAPLSPQPGGGGPAAMEAELVPEDAAPMPAVPAGSPALPVDPAPIPTGRPKPMQSPEPVL